MMQTRKQLKYLVLGSIIFTLYIFAALLFKPSGTETSWEKVRWSIMIFFLIVFFSYFAFAVFWRTRETGFRIFTTADGKSRFNSLNALFKSSSTDGEKGKATIVLDLQETSSVERLKKASKNKEKFWLLGFVVVVVITLLLYTVLKTPGYKRWETVGIITIVCMHLFILWNFLRAVFYEEELHSVTKFFIGCCLVFWSIAFFFPHRAEQVVIGAKSVINELDGVPSPPLPPATTTASAQQSANVPAVYQPQMQTLQVVPGGGFKKVNIPPGRILKDLTWNCPGGCILEIVHGGQPLCPTTGIYQGLPCGSLSPEVGNSGATVYREQFSVPYGVFINFPRDLVVVGVAFGTDAVLGPIEVTATITL